MEVFNEVFIQLFTYHYMFFKQSSEPNFTIGYSYIFFYLFNFVVNLKAVLFNLFMKVIPLQINKLKKKQKDKLYKAQK